MASNPGLQGLALPLALLLSPSLVASKTKAVDTHKALTRSKTLNTLERNKAMGHEKGFLALPLLKCVLDVSKEGPAGQMPSNGMQVLTIGLEPTQR